MQISDNTSAHYIRHTPFFFLLDPSFADRTGLKPIPELYVATSLIFHRPVIQQVTGRISSQQPIFYSIKLMNIPELLLIKDSELLPINSHVPDGICKHKIASDSYLRTEQILYMMEHPLHLN